MKKTTFIFLLIVILWGMVIFYASSRSSKESNSNSKRIITFVLTKSISITNKYHITNIDLSNDNVSRMVLIINKPLRKVVHYLIYFVLAVFVYLLFYSLGCSKLKILLFTCFLCFFYSLTDELHQTRVDGRSGQFLDCIIDTSGAITSSLILFFKKK